MSETQTREQQPAVTATTLPPAAVPPAPVATVPAQPDTATEVRALAQLAGADAPTTQALLAMNPTPEQARAFLIAHQTSRTAPPPIAATVTATLAHDDPAQTRALIAEALYMRHNPAHKPTEAARAFIGATTLDIARDRLQRAGQSVLGLSAADTIQRALATTDFPMLLTDSSNRILRERYALAASPVRNTLARQATAKDFRAKNVIRMDDGITLEKVLEHGEFKTDGTLIDTKESYRIDTFGKIVSITRQALINDDLGAFNDLSARLGDAAARFEAATLVTLLTTASGLGPLMDDGKTLFHADHGNLAASGAAPDETTLSDATVAMYRQKTPVGGAPYPVRAKYLVVPPELETHSKKLLTAIQATKTADVNPFSNLDLLVEPLLTDTNRWYLSADPAALPCLEFSYLQGAEGPQLETKVGFEVDGVQIKVRLDYGAAFLDWRGLYMNPGA
ncbi:Mu-like prophage major head subunit gpT family protein [Elstera cyanobacteriorum]|uniref:phage major capsid protein n=1 Tax=Elstera cyanobacteriorum TaxID=2022747 RepID=UPI0023547C83|nr:Mu-like prophage major head subunit gpT family protein [Elstera cyanobacteriorum]MCK6444110.1 Mu-like prophage major head subunit gpT family protein [Elstera cyanobacteriorum]